MNGWDPFDFVVPYQAEFYSGMPAVFLDWSSIKKAAQFRESETGLRQRSAINGIYDQFDLVVKIAADALQGKVQKGLPILNFPGYLDMRVAPAANATAYTKSGYFLAVGAALTGNKALAGEALQFAKRGLDAGLASGARFRTESRAEIIGNALQVVATSTLPQTTKTLIAAELESLRDAGKLQLRLTDAQAAEQQATQADRQAAADQFDQLLPGLRSGLAWSAVGVFGLAAFWIYRSTKK